MANTCENVDNPRIKTAAYWTAPTMGIEQAKVLARHDLLIVDMENMINSYSSLKLLKALNTDLKLICYSNPMEFYKPMTANRPLQYRYLKEVEENYHDWFLKDLDGNNVVYWNGMIMMNLSSACPRYPLVGNYGKWMAHNIIKDVLSNAIWDGYFMDNGGGNISWINPRMDINNSRLTSSTSYIDKSWYEGLEDFLQEIDYQMGSSFILLANKGSLDFVDILDGRMFENFPNDYLGSTKDFGWHQSMENSQTMSSYGLKYNIFTVKKEDVEFGLASALLLDDVYVAIEQDYAGFPKILETDLGKPLGPYQKDGQAFVRFFQNGKVVVVPNLRLGELYLSSEKLARN